MQIYQYRMWSLIYKWYTLFPYLYVNNTPMNNDHNNPEVIMNATLKKDEYH